MEAKPAAAVCGDDLLSKLISGSQTFDKFPISVMDSRTSNGYLEYIFRRAASDLFKVEIDSTQKLVYTQGKNRHYQEVTYPGVPLKFVMAYGFQHIQNIIRKLKTNKCDY